MGNFTVSFLFLQLCTELKKLVFRLTRLNRMELKNKHDNKSFKILQMQFYVNVIYPTCLRY